MNAIFTIASKNYLSFAISLWQSVKLNHPEMDYFIILADELSENMGLPEGVEVIEAKSLGIEKFYEMAFKYNIIEFNTSIKPFVFELLFNKKKYEKILYIDPDMYIFKPLNEALEKLEDHFIVLTPHISKPYIKYDGATSEEELLFVGIYNLGFIGLRDTRECRTLLLWWMEKLRDQCFGDHFDALHVDQKWMDFAPALFGKDVHILRNPAYNMAFWNFHERTFFDNGNGYNVDDSYKLALFHFSGFVPEKYESICRKQNKFSLQNSPQYQRLFKEYAKLLFENGHERFKNMPYVYGTFKNGIGIQTFHRRLFRALLNEKKLTFDDPFSVGLNSLYQLFLKNKLIINTEATVIIGVNKSQVQGYDLKNIVLKKILTVMKSLMGIKNYYMLIQFMLKMCRFENQLFLINKR
jgi:hypothetical protein